ncbi:hypothetical protein DH2020_014936 [Rehmannia glutinosa]|uniref:F-box domain-containing protein n=1 Tax=Rehmannia glutinosa TaxID=99300 RepID=A0ABR0WYD3_REHGL
MRSTNSSHDHYAKNPNCAVGHFLHDRAHSRHCLLTGRLDVHISTLLLLSKPYSHLDMCTRSSHSRPSPSFSLLLGHGSSPVSSRVGVGESKVGTMASIVRLGPAQQQVYIEDVEEMFDVFMLSLNTVIGDGSIEEFILQNSFKIEFIGELATFWLTEITRDNRRVSSEPGEQQVEFELPTEVLALILSQLNMRDNIRASAVCRNWLAIAASVRRANNPPWLMFFPKYGDMYEFYDPSQRKTYHVELPQLRGSRICYAKDGWLLLFGPGTKDIFFFCPYTREMIELPKLQSAHQIVAFSAAPTCPNCLLFTVKNVTNSIISVSTCRPGETQWSTVNFECPMTFYSNTWNKIVFCNGCFLCLNVNGALGAYDPENVTWKVVLRPPGYTHFFSVHSSWRAKFMAEHDGDVFVVYTCAAVNPVIYKLNLMHRVWEEMRSLGGMTLFASFLSSHAMTDILGKMRSNVCFSKVLLYGKHCVTYSPDAGRYYPRNQLYDWEEQDPFESIWIESPKDPSIFLQR